MHGIYLFLLNHSRTHAASTICHHERLDTHKIFSSGADASVRTAHSTAMNGTGPLVVLLIGFKREDTTPKTGRYRATVRTSCYPKLPCMVTVTARGLSHCPVDIPKLTCIAVMACYGMGMRGISAVPVTVPRRNYRPLLITIQNNCLSGCRDFWSFLLRAACGRRPSLRY